MARTLSEIYSLAKQAKDGKLEANFFQTRLEASASHIYTLASKALGAANNKSVVSIIDAFLWIVSVCIWVTENMLDVFKVDLALDLQNRVNGTPGYFVNALLKYQEGYTLEMDEDGLHFSYPAIDEEARIIKKVAYEEFSEPGFHDNILLLKIAGKNGDDYTQIETSRLDPINGYLNKILFAGQKAKVVSRKGDVLVLKLNVYSDSAITASELQRNIEKSLSNFIHSLEFNGVLYYQRIIDAIQSVEHVVDVEVDAEQGHGIYLAQYDDDNNLAEENGSNLINIQKRRYVIPNSGYIRESNKSGVEKDLPKWSESITIKVEKIA